MCRLQPLLTDLPRGRLHHHDRDRHRQDARVVAPVATAARRRGLAGGSPGDDFGALRRANRAPPTALLSESSEQRLTSRLRRATTQSAPLRVCWGKFRASGDEWSIDAPNRCVAYDRQPSRRAPAVTSMGVYDDQQTHCPDRLRTSTTALRRSKTSG